MRIIGGKWRGKKLCKIKDSKETLCLRPTKDRVKESIFNILMHGSYPSLQGKNILDLCAGTGALGFEALSRGSDFVNFIDNSTFSVSIIKNNCKILGVDEEANVLKCDVTDLKKNGDKKYNYVFLDPPYGKGLGELALMSAMRANFFSAGCIIIWEEKNFSDLPPEFNSLEIRNFQRTRVNFLQYCG